MLAKAYAALTEAICGSAATLHKVGALDNATMRAFDARHLVVLREIAPAQIKTHREANNVSQPVFAHYLDTSESPAEKWESGAKRPSRMALKLLTIVQKHGLQILARVGASRLIRDRSAAPCSRAPSSRNRSWRRFQ